MCEDGNSKLVEVVTVANVDAEVPGRNSLYFVADFRSYRPPTRALFPHR